MPFYYIFWGFVFFFNFHFGIINLMPNSIAYFLIGKGLAKLGSSNPYLDKAREMATPLIFLSLPNIFKLSVLGFSLGIAGIILSFITLIVQLIFSYNFCYGLDKLASSLEYHELENKAKFYWVIYLIQGIMYLIGLFIPSLIESFFIVLFVIGLMYYFGMLVLLRKFYTRTKENYNYNS